ncbi:CBU_0592 family membrane protein [Actinoallomurus sp. CA-150999]|uniref:CBU_0592 family membrane protein n=1 Tax=Actinoallomurus sp. CA-150999 TaxID=3239887 RepID=UPI003D91E875
MGQYVQIFGSLLILGPFILAQLGRLAPASVSYLGFNLAGSALLAVDAGLGGQWGFLLLESAWACVSAFSLARTRRRHRRSAGTSH